MNHMILFVLFGFFISSGIFLRTKAKLQQSKTLANRFNFFGFLSTFIGIGGLYYMIVVYRTHSLFADLFLLFSSMVVTLGCFLLASR